MVDGSTGGVRHPASATAQHRPARMLRWAMLCALPVCADAFADLSGLEAIEAARRVPTRLLGPGLPLMDFEDWLRKLGPFGATVTFESNHCGTDLEKADQDLPICVDATADLGGGRRALVTLKMGTVQKGLSPRPTVSWVAVDAPAEERVTPLPDLDALRRLPRW